MAPKSPNPNTQKGKSKATYEEKGKRKASTSSPQQPKRQARTRSHGIHIGEGIPPSTPSSHLSQSDETLFVESFSKRKFTKCKYVDLKFFDEENFLFPTWLRDYSLEKFLTYKDTTFEELLRLFYFYLKWDAREEKYTSYIKGVHVSFSLQDFASILDLPFDEVEDLNETSTEYKIQFLTGKSTLPVAAFLSRELKNVDFRILFNIVCYCIYPRAGGFDKVNLDDIELLYALINGLSMGLVHTMVTYMIDQRSRMNGHLPFGMALTKLFRHFNINLSTEKYQEVTSYNVIKISTLKRMRLIKKDGVWVDKGNEQPLPHQQEGEDEEEEVNQDQGVDPQEGFDHFAFEDLIGSSTPSQPHTTSQPTTHPTPTPSHPPSSHMSTPPTSQPSSSIPPPQVDLTPILSYLESQFTQLNSRVSQIELKVDQVSTDLSSFKQEVRSNLTETQNKLDLVESSFGTHCPKIHLTLEEIQKFQTLHQEALQASLHSATVAIKDIRDNSDRLCLKFKLPVLGSILKDLDAQIRAEYLRSRKERPPPSSSQSKSSKPRKPKASKAHISDPDDSDPYEDKPASESE